MVVALAVATACASAVVAYAASRPGAAQTGLGNQHGAKQSPASAPGEAGAPPARERLLRARLIETPAQTTAVSDPQFRFHVPPRRPLAAPPASPAAPAPAPVPTSSRRFQCRLDGGEWSGCDSPHRLASLTPGSHHFAVRAFNREERAGEAVEFEWRQTPPVVAPAAATAPPPTAEVPPAAAAEGEPKQFSILALREPEGLYPGLAPTPIPVRLTNPNDVAIAVTAVAVAIGDAPANCGAENFALTPADVSSEHPVLVPAQSSVELPAAGVEAPTIEMLNLPFEQDACRGAEIPLRFSGEAQG